jgi:hypothetical protein
VTTTPKNRAANPPSPLANNAIAALLEAVAGAEDVADPDDFALALLTTLEALLATLEELPAALALDDVVVVTVLFATTTVPVTVLDILTGPGPISKLVVNKDVVVGCAVAVAVVVDRPALNWAHRASPMDSTAASCVAGQEARRQGPTMAAMEAWVGPHWQASSVGAQLVDVFVSLMGGCYSSDFDSPGFGDGGREAGCRTGWFAA